MVNIDWITVYQDHLSGVSTFGDYRVTKTRLGLLDVELFLRTGLSGDVLVYDGIHARSVRGSYDTGLMISADARTGRVSVSGNPSKFGRIDNLFGFQSVVDAIEGVFNPVLVHLGLPPFNCNSLDGDLWDNIFGKGMVWRGAVLTRVDLCSNYSLGSNEQVVPFIKYLGSKSDRLRPHIFPDCRTVEWGGSAVSGKGTKYVYRKVYDKLFEMEKHFDRLFKLGTYLTEDDGIYIDRLHSWLQRHGVFRFEVEFKSTFLLRKGIQLPMIADRFLSFFYKDYADRLLISTDMEITDMVDIPGALEGCVVGQIHGQDELVSRRYAERLTGIYQSWMSGIDIKSKMSRNDWYRARRALREGLGVDIAVPSEVVVMPVKVRVFDVRPLEKPDWYRDVQRVA